METAKELIREANDKLTIDNLIKTYNILINGINISIKNDSCKSVSTRKPLKSFSDMINDVPRS